MLGENAVSIGDKSSVLEIFNFEGRLGVFVLIVKWFFK
jgi:hypothetical protein